MSDIGNVSWSPGPELVYLYGLVQQFLVPADSTVFYFNTNDKLCNGELFLPSNNTGNPQIIWRRDEPYPALYHRHGCNIFAVVCLAGNSFKEELQHLASSLTRLRSVRMLIEVDGEESSWRATQILQLCQQYSMLNVVMYFQRWSNHLSIYSYQAFPHFQLVKQPVSRDQPPDIFPNQLKDLKGYKLRAQPDLSPPNTFRFRGQHGEKVAGFLWQYIVSFAENLNAQVEVVYPIFPRRKVGANEYMLEFTRNGSTDFGLTTTMIVYKHEERPSDYSYPIMFSSWCTLLPTERPLGTATLFEHVLVLDAAAILLIGYLLMFLAIPQLIKCLGINCRDRTMRLAIRLFTLILLSACSAQLLSLLIYPPQMPWIRSFDDLVASGLKIFGMRGEFYFLEGGFRAKYASVFHLTEDPNQLYDNRNYFNTSWAYTITSIKWMVIQAQQRYFARPVFRLSEDLCFQWNSPCGLLIAPESAFRERLMHFSLNVDQAGLLGRWITQSFYDMVRAGRMTIKDYSQSRPMRALGLQDLRVCWRICGISLLIAGIVFAIELLLFYTNVFLNSL
ncbi:hypothetical protein KR018_006855 [Drosophila ironensis]|nr:hypothetical protein KR018_006855 [Drosophila ironensis]